MEIDRTPAAATAQDQEGWPTLGAQSSRPGRDFVDPANRSALARPARPVSQPIHLLATVTKVGGRKGLVGHLACLSVHSGRTRTAGLERGFCGWQFRTGKK